MEAYINSLSCISHHPTFNDDFFFKETSVLPSSNFLFVTPPVYRDYIPATMIRRASHILKMGLSAGLMCLKQEGEEKTDAIIIGTAMGCYEDTDKFLRSLNENAERMLTPTSFIQSTHNTVAGQLALLVKCHGYNFTYVHQNLSFEYALLDALLLLKEGEAKSVLVGGVDELIPPLCELFERAGHIKKTVHLAEPIWQSKTKGYVAGEGAVFFKLGAKSASSIAKIRGVRPIQKISDTNELSIYVDEFLNNCGLTKHDLSVVLSGINGDTEKDKNLNEYISDINLPVAYFKHLCGEYFTASAFALWFAAQILKKQEVPTCAVREDRSVKNIRHILIVTHHNDRQYSLICVSQC